MAIGGSQNQVESSNYKGDPAKAGTTFVQADPTSFRDLVQRLTGPPHATPPQPIPKSTQKLHERRKYSKTRLEISKPNGFQFQSPTQPKIPLSPGVYSPMGGFGLGTQSYPATPYGMTMISPGPSSGATMPCSLKRASSVPVELNLIEEEKAINEKRFYLHPSPRSKQRISPKPELLTLFPLDSPTGDGATGN